MPTTFIRTNTNSGLGGGQDFNKAILLPGSDATGSQLISVGANSTRNSFGYTDVGIPGADGITGDYTVEMEVITAQNDIQLSCAVARVDSAGNQQAISSFSAEQQATAGVRTFNFTNLDLGTWASGDRLRITYRYRNTHSHTSRDIEVNHGGTNNEVIAPWDTTLPATDVAVAGTFEPFEASASIAEPLPEGYSLVQETSTDNHLTDAESITLTFDQAPAEGTLLLAMLGSAAGRTITPPSGWTTVRTDDRSHVFTKIATASEATQHVFTTPVGEATRLYAVGYEFTGLNDTVDATSANALTTVNSISTGTAPPTTTGTVAIALVALNVARAFDNAWTNSFVQQTVLNRMTTAIRTGVPSSTELETTESWLSDDAAGFAEAVVVAMELVPEDGSADVDVAGAFEPLEASASISVPVSINLPAPWEYVGFEAVTGDATGNTDTITIPKPAGVAEGTLLLAFIGHEGHASTGVNWTPPSGWTQLGTIRNTNGASHSVSYYKVATDSEPADYSWSEDDVNSKHGVIVAVAGVDLNSPLDDWDEFDDDDSGTSMTVTAGQDNTLLFAAGNKELVNTDPAPIVTNPDGMEEVYSHAWDQDAEDPGQDWLSIGAFIEVVASGPVTRTLELNDGTGDTNNMQGVLGAFVPASDVAETVDVAGSFEALEGSASIDASADITVAEVFLSLEASAVIDSSADADVAATFPAAEASVGITASNSASIAGTFPTLEASAAISASADVDVADTFSALSASAQLTAATSLDVAGTFEALEAEVAIGTEAIGINAAGTFPALTASIATSASADVEATAAFPALAGAATLQASSTADVSGSFPVLEGEAVVSSEAGVTVEGLLPSLDGDASLAVENNVAVQGLLPALEASATTDASSTADVAGTFPAFDASILVATDIVGINVVATLPALESAVGITATADADVAGTLPALIGSAGVASSSSADIAASFEALDASASVEVIEEAETVSVSAVLPELEADVSIASSLDVAVAGSFEALVGSADVTVEEEALAVNVAGTFPALAGSASFTSVASANVSATLPELGAAVTVTSASSVDIDAGFSELTASADVSTGLSVEASAEFEALVAEAATTSSSLLNIASEFEALVASIRMAEPPTIEPLVVSGRYRSSVVRTKYNPTATKSGYGSTTITSRPGGNS